MGIIELYRNLVFDPQGMKGGRDGLVAAYETESSSREFTGDT